MNFNIKLLQKTIISQYLAENCAQKNKKKSCFESKQSFF